MIDKLQIVDIEKAYIKTSGILNKINFSVKNSEFLSILGPSGCGKTTLLRILIGLLKPDSGRILKDGVDITDFTPDKRKMGIVFQNYALFENMTAIENVAYALKVKKETRNIAYETALKMLEIVGLRERKDNLPKNLSGGQQQRVAIARTLSLNPDVILFDEPMSALDVDTRIAMRKELKKLQKTLGTTMIYVTHDQEEAFALSDRIMIMDKGNISQIDTPENICRFPQNDYVKSFVLGNLQAKVNSLSRFINSK